MIGLSEDELNAVTGGTGMPGALAAQSRKLADLGSRLADQESVADAVRAAAGNNTVKAMCPVCGKETDFRIFSGGRAVCSICGTQKLM